jgi:hypothetical protein
MPGPFSSHKAAKFALCIEVHHVLARMARRRQTGKRLGEDAWLEVCGRDILLLLEGMQIGRYARRQICVKTLHGLKTWAATDEVEQRCLT